MTMMAADSVFLDTNGLVFATIASAPWHEAAVRAIRRLEGAGHDLWISRQIIREYLAVLSRPQTFGKPVSIAVLVAQIRVFEQRFRVAEESADVTAKLLDLLQELSIGGKQVHDANIVATMQAYGIGRLLTHNVRDFARFAPRIEVIDLEQSP